MTQGFWAKSLGSDMVVKLILLDAWLTNPSRVNVA